MIGYLVAAVVGFVAGMFAYNPLATVWASKAHDKTRVITYRDKHRRKASGDVA